MLKMLNMLIARYDIIIMSGNDKDKSCTDLPLYIFMRKEQQLLFFFCICCRIIVKGRVKINLDVKVINDKIYLNDMNTSYNNIVMSAPKYFSISKNTEETVNFFNEVAIVFLAENFEGRFIFDLTNVEEITADAVMYMNALAIERLSMYRRQIVSLTWPKDKRCQQFIKRCGLGNYLSDKKNCMIETKNFYTIVGGKTTDVDRIREIGFFVCNKMKVETKDIDFITSTFVELMNNTQQHAYDLKKDKLWYVFLEDTKGSIKCTFLDLGKGIPETMRKSFKDNINDLFPILEDDHSYFIYEALKGEYVRSSTNDAYRNTGLPEIYNYYKLGKISKLQIISCKGICTFFDSNRPTPKLFNLNHNFKGTLFTWEIKKERR